MRKREETIKWLLKDLSELPTFSEEFRTYCEEMDLDENKIFELELSLEELIVNSFTHGYKKKEGGSVKVEAKDTGPDVRISLQDTAPPFDLFRDAPAPRLGGEDGELEPEPEPEPEPEQEIEEEQEKQGGLGIHLVKSLNDKVEYYGSKDGNIVVIVKSKT